MKVVLTGGAGFIGRSWINRFIHDKTIEAVYVIDAFLPQVHGPQPDVPRELSHEKITVIAKSIQSIGRDAIAALCQKCDAVIHLASDTGVGQSMYELARYTDNNVLATAVLLEGIVSGWKDNPQNKRIVLSSSRAVYGEGSYVCPQGHGPQDQYVHQEAIWDPVCMQCGTMLVSCPTPPSANLKPLSIYASTKQIQEQMIEQVAKNYRFKYFNLRFFNVFGPGQAFGNPYTGILTTFLLRARKGDPLYIYEDGKQSRDFVYIDDVTSSIWAALNSVFSGTYNIGTGQPRTIYDVGGMIAKHYNMGESSVQITGRHRVGDIRHCTADRASSKSCLGWQPQIRFDDAMNKYLEWFDSQQIAAPELSEAAWSELTRKGMGWVRSDE